MKNLSRAAATVVAAIGIAAFAVPTASAAPVGKAEKAAHPVSSPSFPHRGASNNYYLILGDALFADESGPGDQSANLTKNSRDIKTEAQNEAISTGDIKTHVKGKGNTLPIEVEGSEQDQGEGA